MTLTRFALDNLLAGLNESSYKEEEESEELEDRIDPWYDGSSGEGAEDPHYLREDSDGSGNFKFCEASG